MSIDPVLHDVLVRLNRLSGELQELREGVKQAVHIAAVDPEMALTRARKVLEFVVRDVYERRVGEPAGTRPLEGLMQRLVKDGHLPKRLAPYANAVRELGNVGTHAFGESVTKADVTQSLAQLTVILEWYFDHERPDLRRSDESKPAPVPDRDGPRTVPPVNPRAATSRPASSPLPDGPPARAPQRPPPGETKAAPTGQTPKRGRRLRAVTRLMASGVFVALAVVGMLVCAGLVTIILSQQSTPAGGSNSATNTGSTPIPTPPEPASTVAPVSGDNAIGLDLGNGVTMEFVRIPAGSFTMGSPKAEQDEFARCAKRDGFSFTITNEDEHPVRISKDFLLGKYPVTQAQYEAIVGSNPSMFKDVPGEDTRLFPVEDVSWEDATAFCDKLSGRTGKKVTLPTEAEWEYACRGGTKTTFYFGETLDGTQANCDGSKPFGTDAKAPYLHRTSRVGAYAGVAPHPLGLCDMHGNVWQWCRDWYDEGYYKRSPNVDPFCNEGEQKYRLLRGGSWRQPAWGCRAAVRRRTAPGDRNGGYGNVGFRVEFRLD